MADGKKIYMSGNQGNKNGYVVKNDYDKQKKEAKLPDGYLANGYYEYDSEKNKSLKTIYVLRFAKDVADAITNGEKAIKKTQLRKYYDAVVKYTDEYQKGEITEKQMLASISELASLAFQAVQKKKAPRIFEEFMSKNIETIKNADDALAFKRHFMAIVCYFPEK